MEIVDQEMKLENRSIGIHTVAGIDGGMPVVLIQSKLLPEEPGMVQLEFIVNDSHWREWGQDLILMLREAANFLEKDLGAN